MSSDVAIRVEGLTKSFRLYERPEHRLMELVSFGRIQRHRTFTALKDVSLEIRRGETVGIVGRNGCGKSTLLQVICGILQPTAGTVTTQGRIAALLELGAGFDGNFTGRENVYLNGALHGRTRAEMDERIDAIIAFADIGEFIDRPVKTYSSGMFVRLAFATAVNVDPDILVVDEALAVGDEAFQRKCFARIEQIKERGATILFVSHAAQTIIQLCDRAVLMDGGEKLMEGTPKAVVVGYQRLARASAAGAASLRAELIKEGSLASRGQAQGNSNDEGEVQPPEPMTPADFLDPSLKPASVVEFERRGAVISGLRVERVAGGAVNLLKGGVPYALRYEVSFSRSVEHVGFSYSIRTRDGLALCGASTFAHHSYQLPRVEAGSLARIEFEFETILNPDVYFICCSVRGILDEEDTILHKLDDALVIRILPEEVRLATFHVDIGTTHRIEIDARPTQTDAVGAP